jgi:hypothetical protein
MTINADTNPPTVSSVEALLTKQHVLVKFSEGIDPATALNTANYTFSGNALTVISASLADLSSVRLKTSVHLPNTTYVLSVSNVQDQSQNTMLGTNKSFTTPNLVPVSYYDAGSNSVVSSAPDPTSTNGGNWRVTVSGTANSFSNISPDVNGLNGWNLTDQSSGAGRVQYFMSYPQSSVDFSFTNGWRLHTRTRFVDDFNGLQTMHLQFCNPVGQRYVLFLDLGGINVDLYAILNPNGTGGIFTNVTTGGVGATDYHDYDIVYNPVTHTAEFYFDGNFMFGNWTGDASTAFSGPFIGSVSDPGLGSMNVNQVDFSVVNAVNPVITTNPVSVAVAPNASVTFRGAASGFVGGYRWYKNGVATGVTGTTYTIASATTADEAQYVFAAYNSAIEVQSTAATLTIPPTISITNSNGNSVITFSGTLQSATTVNGTYTDVIPTPTSPLIITNPSSASLFFRTAK